MSEGKPRELEEYLMANGESPFATWLRSLKDKRARARIRLRLDRLSLGNLGDCDAVGGGVLELRLHFGPGYRIYVAEDGPTIVLLLCGGIKRSQRLDIKAAQEYWRDYKRRKP